MQELCRVMFDALEQKWKQTEQVSLEKLTSFSGVVLWTFVGFSYDCKNHLLNFKYQLPVFWFDVIVKLL